MRELSDALTAAQQSSSGYPYVYVKVGETDYTPRVKAIRQTEKPFGGIAYIILNNHDKSISADMRGDMVRVGWGFKIGESQEYSFAPPMWVLRQQSVSSMGQLTVELECIDIWGKLNLLRVIGGGGVKLTGTITGTLLPGYKVTGGTSGATGTIIRAGDGYIAVVRIDGTFSTETVTHDLDADVKIDVSSVDDYAGGAPPRWNGTKTYLEIIEDLTDGIVDIVLDSSDGRIDNGSDSPFFETENNTPISNIIQELISRTKCGIRAQDDDGVCKLHIFNATAAPETPNYDYDTDHSFLIDVKDISCVLPNQVIVAWGEFGLTDIDAYYGFKKDDAAIARFGIEISQLLTIEVDSDSDAEDIADAKLNRIQKEAARGNVTAPMNCGQELFDYIKVTDTRAGVENYGWIGTIDRYWQVEGMAQDYDEDHPYRIEVGLGNLTSRAISTLPAYPLPPVPTPSPTPSPGEPILVPFHYPASIQGYVHSLTFTAANYYQVSWTSGTVQFYDGTSHSINSGSHNLANDDVVYLYFKLTTATLQATTNYIANCDIDTGLVCIIQRGRADGGEGVPEIKATVIPSSGKMPLICADHIHMSGITMDDISDGGAGENHYKRVMSTDISAGHIVLHVDQNMDSQGIEIFSNAPGASTPYIALNSDGIEGWDKLVGSGGVKQFYIRAADGKGYFAAGEVILDKDGMHILGEKIYYYDENEASPTPQSNDRVRMYYLKANKLFSIYNRVHGGAIRIIWEDSDGNVRQLAGCEDALYMFTGAADLGLEAKRFGKLWCSDVDATGDVGADGDLWAGDEVKVGDDIQMEHATSPSIIYSTADTVGAIGNASNHPQKIYADYLYWDISVQEFQEYNDVEMLRDIMEKAHNAKRLRSEHFPDIISKLTEEDIALCVLHAQKRVAALRKKGKDDDADTLEATIPNIPNTISQKRMVNAQAWNSLLTGAIVQQDDRIKLLEARLASLEGGR